MIKIPETRIYNGETWSITDLVNEHWNGVHFWVKEITTFFRSIFLEIQRGGIIQTTTDPVIFNLLYSSANLKGKETKKALLKRLRNGNRIDDFYITNCTEILLILNFIETNLNDIIIKEPSELVKLGNELLFNIITNKSFFEYGWINYELVEVLKELKSQEKLTIFIGFLQSFNVSTSNVYTLQNGYYKKFVKKYFFEKIRNNNELHFFDIKPFWRNKIGALNRDLILHLVNPTVDIIGQKPSDILSNVGTAIWNNLGPGIISNSIYEPIGFSPKVECIISSIFSYDKFIKKGLPSGFKDAKYWQAYDLSSRIGMDTCSYCNINYTHTIIAEGKRISRPDFDHFFIKSKYPLLAISFYNLIPSCKICNSTLKGAVDTTLENNIHPYIEGFGDNGTFYFKLQNVYTPTIEIGVSGAAEVQRKIEGNKKTFKLEKVYNVHINLLREIIFRLSAYDDEYIQEIAKKFNWRPEDLYQFVFGSYEAEDLFYKRPFSKMNKNIVENTVSYLDHKWNWSLTR
jgi:hypothetical protein